MTRLRGDGSTDANADALELKAATALQLIVSVDDPGGAVYLGQPEVTAWLVERLGVGNE